MPNVTRPVAERFWSKVQKRTEPHPAIGSPCWIWTAAINNSGYGSFAVAHGKSIGAHRWAYESTVGSVPSGMELDHLCRDRSCVNPAHLEPVTKAENVRRGLSPMAEQARRTHCPQGHPYSAENTILDEGSRRCLICRRARSAARAHRATKTARGIPHAPKHGEASASAKLTWAKVAEIRRRAPNESHAALAREFGVSDAAVSMLLSGKTWPVRETA